MNEDSEPPIKQPPDVIWVRFSDTGQNIRQWNYKPFEGATQYSTTTDDRREGE